MKRFIVASKFHQTRLNKKKSDPLFDVEIRYKCEVLWNVKELTKFLKFRILRKRHSRLKVNYENPSVSPAYPKIFTKVTKRNCVWYSMLRTLNHHIKEHDASSFNPMKKWLESLLHNTKSIYQVADQIKLTQKHWDGDYFAFFRVT